MTGSCTTCGAGVATAQERCPSCGAPLPKVLAERVAATRVYGAPPPVPLAPHLLSDGDPTSQPVLAETPPSPRRRRRRLVVAGVVALVMVASGLWFADYLRDRPVRQALERANASYATMLTSFTQAEDLAGVRVAGQGAAATADTLEQVQADLEERQSDTARLVAGQQRVAAVAATLAGLTEARLAIWGAAERGLSDARTDLLAVSRALDEQVTDPADAVEHVRGVVGASATEVVTRSTAALVRRLSRAERTVAVRRIALDARNETAVVAVAQTGLSGTSSSSVEAVGVLLDQMARLQRLDGDHLALWNRVRGDLVTALAGTSTIDGRPAVDRLDELVGEGRAALARWRTALAKAKRKQAAARATIAAYSSAVSAQLSGFDAERASLTGYLGRLLAGEVGLDPATLLSASTSRSAALHAAVKAITVPAPFDEVHRDLQRTFGQTSRVMAQALPFFSQCYDRCSGGYAYLSGVTERVATRYNEAKAAWHQAVAAARQRIADQALPKRPRI